MKINTYKILIDGVVVHNTNNEKAHNVWIKIYDKYNVKYRVEVYDFIGRPL
jgi:hypothetical protein